ncbi:Ig-like domain-containing protein [Brevibacillus sp. SYSU BS000544]|uniref:RCC1 domain-containing protein n=1 Tax=Brevibacillus sp. SYSU BS000544 TaxID=3416443 RepID=UPI003CE5342B
MRVLVSIVLLLGLWPLQGAAAGGVTKISGHTYHTLALMDDGTVWAWGRNEAGQLGNGNATNSNTPEKVSGLSDIIDVFAKAFNSYALKRDGTVWAWGGNANGELGNGSKGYPSYTPVKVVGAGGTGALGGITSIASGQSHAIALKNDGTVWAWGDNGSGQLGNGKYVDSYTPVQVKDPDNPSQPLSDVISIYASEFTSVALKSDGTVWTWGINYEGTLGNDTDTTTTSNLPVQVVDKDDPTGFLTDVKQVSAGVYHVLALKGDGSVMAWGSNFFGQLGIGNGTDFSNTAVPVLRSEGAGKLTNIKTIGGAFNHSFAVGKDGTLWGWGDNAYGALSIVTDSNEVYYPIQTAMSGVTKAVGGVRYSIFMKNDGTVWGVGFNEQGELGDGTNSNTTTPVQTKLGGSTNPTNKPPIATGSTFTTSINQSFSGYLQASDADNDPLTYSIDTTGTNGTVSLGNSSTGAFTYTPKTGQTGTDTFTFKVNDGKVDSNTATVTISITSTPPPPVTGIKLNQTEMVLVENGSPVKLKATIIPEDATDYEIVWKSSDRQVAEVDQNGLVTPLETGEATITAMEKESGVEAECIVTVVPEGNVTLEVSEKNLLLMPSNRAKLTIYAVTEDGMRKNVTFDKDTVFASDDQELVTIQQNVVTAGKKLGETTITVTYQGNMVTIPVTVSKIGVTKLRAEEKWITLQEGDSEQLDVIAQFTNKKTENVTDLATWLSYQPSIVEVIDGEIHALKEGKAKIRATYGGKSFLIYVTVK